MTHEWLTSDPRALPEWDPDYVFLGQNAHLVAESARYLEAAQNPPCKTFSDLFYHAQGGSRWIHTVCSVLVYADIEGTEEHKEAMATSRKWELEEAEYDERWNHGKNIISKVIKAYLTGRPDTEPDPEKTDFTEDDLDSLTAEDPSLQFRLPGRVVDHLIELPSKSDKSTALDFISGEMRKWDSRPTMLLIALFDDLQSELFDQGSGYAVTYDFLEDTIIIKKYQSESIAGRFPLHEPWYKFTSEDNDDLIQTIGSPAQIAQRIIDGVLPHHDDPDYGFAVLIQALAGAWICRHFWALQTVTHEEHGTLLTTDLLGQLTMKMEDHELLLRDLPFSRRVKVHKDGVDNAGSKRTYLTALTSWSNLRSQFRTQAWKAHQRGKTEEAEGFVDVWHRVDRVLKAKTERPDAEVDWQSELDES